MSLSTGNSFFIPEKKEDRPENLLARLQGGYFLYLLSRSTSSFFNQLFFLFSQQIRNSALPSAWWLFFVLADSVSKAIF
ncbi:hypothetical protein LWW51_002709 [Salmonella enterica]|nr:hypothetical protein [Salmonella enterica]